MHDADRPTKGSHKLKKHGLEEGHSLETVSMCWSPPSAGHNRGARRHYLSRGGLTWAHRGISYSPFFMGHQSHGRSSHPSHEPRPAASPC